MVNLPYTVYQKYTKNRRLNYGHKTSTSKARRKHRKKAGNSRKVDKKALRGTEFDF